MTITLNVQIDSTSIRHKSPYLLVPGDKVRVDNTILVVAGVKFNRPFYYEIRTTNGGKYLVKRNESVEVVKI